MFALAGAGCGRQRGDAGYRRLSRARERTGPDILGRFLDGHQGGGSGRRDHHRGHAAVSDSSYPSLLLLPRLKGAKV